MASKNFTGTVTIGATPYNVTATLARRGLRVTGHVVFDDDTDRVIPLNLFLQGGSFTTPASIWFIDPDDNSIELLSLSIAETTIDSNFKEIDIAAADCGVGGAPSTLSMDLDAVVTVVDNGGVEDPSAVIAEGVRKEIQPIRINEIGNSADHFGGLLSLPRLSGETNTEYIARIRDVMSNPANSTYKGLLNGITRDLGLEREPAIRVTAKASPAGGADKIRFYIDEKEAIIYTEWVPITLQESGIVPTVEIQTELDDMTIGKLVDWINTSGNYEAEAIGDTSKAASHLAIGDSRFLYKDQIPGQEIMTLRYENIIPDSLAFPPQEELSIELEEGSALTMKGQYYVDYSAGRIFAHTPPPEDVEFTYTVNSKDFLLTWFPVKITSFTSEGGQNLFFNQVEREFYTSEITRYVNGLPTNEAYGIMRKILTAGKFPQFWGE